MKPLLAKAFEPMAVIPSWRTRFPPNQHPLKAPAGIVVKLWGITRFPLRFLQFLNAPAPIVTTQHPLWA